MVDPGKEELYEGKDLARSGISPGLLRRLASGPFRRILDA